jgi:hypothetical protein
MERKQMDLLNTRCPRGVYADVYVVGSQMRDHRSATAAGQRHYSDTALVSGFYGFDHVLRVAAR